VINLLSANVEYTPHDDDVTYSGCSVPRTGEVIKNGLQNIRITLCI